MNEFGTPALVAWSFSPAVSAEAGQQFLKVNLAAAEVIKQKSFLGAFTILQNDNVGPQIGSELRQKGVLAVVLIIMLMGGDDKKEVASRGGDDSAESAGKGTDTAGEAGKTAGGNTPEPAAKAGASFQPVSSSGEFHGTIIPHTPTGSRRM